MTKEGNTQWHSEAVAVLNRHSLADDKLLAGIQKEFAPPFYDVAIIHHEDDRLSAGEFRDHLINEIFDDKKVKAVLYDDMIDPEGRLSKFQFTLAYSSFIFIFITERYVKDESKIQEREQFILQTLHNPEKRWTVIPVYTEPRSSINYKIPIGLNSLKGLNYWSNDDFYRDTVKQLLRDKVAVREQKEQRHRLLKNNDFKNDRADRPVQEEDKRRTKTSSCCCCPFSPRTTRDYTVRLSHLDRSGARCRESEQFTQECCQNRQNAPNRLAFRDHSISGRCHISTPSGYKRLDYGENENGKFEIIPLSSFPRSESGNRFPSHSSRTRVSDNSCMTTQPNASLPVNSKFTFPSDAYTIRGPPSDFSEVDPHIWENVGENNISVQETQTTLTQFPPPLSRYETRDNQDRPMAAHICDFHHCRNEICGCGFIPDIMDRFNSPLATTDLEFDSETDTDILISEVIADLLKEDTFDGLCMKDVHTTNNQYKSDICENYYSNNSLLGLSGQDTSTLNSSFEQWKCDDSLSCRHESSNSSNDFGDICSLVC